MRCLHELTQYDDSIFVTLTYDDAHLPSNASLVKSDLQKFYKRLRKALNDRKIRYFACGEYGDTTQRPHYHSIIFGLSLSLEDRQLVMDAWPYCDWTNPHIRNKSFGLAEHDSISYVAQYVDKKFSGDLAEEEYVKKNREPVFKLSSLGIGRGYCDSYADQLRANGSINYRGTTVTLPRYYLDRLGIPSDLHRDEILDDERDMVDRLVGVRATMDELYMTAKPDQVRQLQERVQSGKVQHNRNLEARAALKSKKL